MSTGDGTGMVRQGANAETNEVSLMEWDRKLTTQCR